MSQAAIKLLQKDVAEAQAQQNMQKMQDPAVQAEMAELQIKQADIQRKTQTDALRLQADLEKAQLQAQIDLKKIQSQEEIEGVKIGARIAEKQVEYGLKDGELSSKDAREGVKIGVDIAKAVSEELKNTQNNK